ncbi:two component transcriptional regulator, LytTR family [Natronincola peptidivorans]|uniref:Stage 0 sporulation protein A homolog n=1 Tax=Natronincola peptidivorans TaxID=426128 RepID=A0A1I0HD39_9FIRM|nr:LytTR family DNA-binding domain-containing protein [Natronincola peptidivorans]SET81626.1 two component transcriptional regulator, LytTR family [Natronincola peptidivorans]
MLRIAICDDTIGDLSNMVSIINDYKALQRDKYKIEYTAFNSAVDLIAAMERGEQYELVLLDILMPFITGMDAAKEIRQFNQDVKIIFLTSSTEFAVEAYSVGAYYYAIKPIWKEKLFILLDKVISEMETTLGKSFLIKSNTGLTRVFINRLEFAEVNGRTILYHLTNGSVIEATGSMTELEKLLSDNVCFIKPHRSYIINMEHIDTLSQREVKMQSLALVPISKANYPIVKLAYINFSFKE